MEGGDAGDGGDHHAGKELHGGDITFAEGAGRGGQHFEDAESAAIVAQGRNQDGADSEAVAACEIHARVAFGVVAEHDFAGADGFGGDAGVGLQADAEVGCGAAGAGAADDFVSGTQGDGGAGRAREVLGALSDGADGWFKIEFGGADFDFLSIFRAGMHGAETGYGMGGVGDAKLAAKRRRRHASVMISDVHHRGIWDGSQEVADEAVEFSIGDEVSRLLMAKSSAEYTREAEQ